VTQRAFADASGVRFRSFVCCLLSQYDNRTQSLAAQLNDVQRALVEAVPDDQRTTYTEQLERLERVIAYAQLVLERTEPELASDVALAELNAPLTSIIADIANAGSNADAWCNQILDASARFPAAQDREPEQRLREAAANFQRSAQQRLNSLKSDFAAARDELGALRDQLDQRK
jgi:hypothetical protein